MSSEPVCLHPDLLNLGPNDHVLIDLSSLEEGVVPQPFPSLCTDSTLGWNDVRNVRLPFSSCAPSDVKEKLGRLLLPQESIDYVTEIIDSYQPRSFLFDYLHHVFNKGLSDQLREHYLQNVIPGMARLALRLPELVTQPIPRLLLGRPGSVTLSQEQAACLLANAFFCTFPKPGFDLRGRKTYFNFERMYLKGRRCKTEKIKCLLHYFDGVLRKMPDGVITVRRYRLGEEVDFSADESPLCELVVYEKGRIEDTDEEMVEIDFANRYIGGGVLNAGCVQEEIRFVLAPELLVSMLICENMDDREAISILGSQRFNDYTGYGDGFTFAERPFAAPGKRDKLKRILSEVVAINAMKFGQHPEVQFEQQAILRELVKAYAGFARHDYLNRPIATGNWGCGVYRGDKQLKSLIQLAVASAHGRPSVHYFTFDDADLSTKLRDVYGRLLAKGVTTGQLVMLLLDYRTSKEWLEKKDLFEYIRRSL